MPTEPSHEMKLVDEPSLGELEKPAEVELTAWRQLILAQSELFAIDTDEDRKENLKQIIAASSQLEELLSRYLSPKAQQLPAPTAWALAYVRYRYSRALAYRELSSVRERWPIADPVEYEEQLAAAYQALLDQTKTVRPEFILLEDRILRRSGQKGRALELLETHQSVIEVKWYLKKRRDLLKELEWGPPHEEASRIYHDAGYRDDP